MHRRTAATAVALALLVPAFLALRADALPVPVESEWLETDWGFVSPSLAMERARKPVVFVMEGYSGAHAPNAYLRMDDGILIALDIQPRAGPGGAYAEVRASIRGTECSGGQFHLYDRRHAWDGYHIIEWIAAQPWSNGNVGMIGHSFSGQTAYWTATTQPPHLKAVSANLLHSDIYRDIFMPGGVQNYIFPVLWAYGAGVVSGAHRVPVTAIEEGTLVADPLCRAHQLERVQPLDPPQPQQEPAWAIAGPTDNEWYQAHAATTYAGLVRIPFYQQTNWHDEQTGPRAVVLAHHVKPDPVQIVGKDGEKRKVVPKLVRTANGDHGWGDMASDERWAFFDVFLRGMPDRLGLFDAPVVNYFEITSNGDSYAAKKSGPAWPFPDTDWQRWTLHADGSLDREAAGADEGTRSYVSGVPRENAWFFESPGTGVEQTFRDDLPDVLSWTSGALASDLVVAGPLKLDLSAEIAGADADFFVTVSDVWPDGSVSYLQRGLLKASHRKVDPLRSHYNAEGERVQPVRSHTNPEPVTPGEATLFEIEVFPLGHVFRAGHRIHVTLATPPAVDGLWGYSPWLHQPAVVTTLHDAASPTSLLLPVVTPDGPIGPAPASCRVPGGFPCVGPSA